MSRIRDAYGWSVLQANNRLASILLQNDIRCYEAMLTETSRSSGDASFHSNSWTKGLWIAVPTPIKSNLTSLSRGFGSAIQVSSCLCRSDIITSFNLGRYWLCHNKELRFSKKNAAFHHKQRLIIKTLIMNTMQHLGSHTILRTRDPNAKLSFKGCVQFIWQTCTRARTSAGKFTWGLVTWICIIIDYYHVQDVYIYIYVRIYCILYNIYSNDSSCICMICTY